MRLSSETGGRDLRRARKEKRFPATHSYSMQLNPRQKFKISKSPGASRLTLTNQHSLSIRCVFFALVRSSMHGISKIHGFPTNKESFAFWSTFPSGAQPVFLHRERVACMVRLDEIGLKWLRISSQNHKQDPRNSDRCVSLVMHIQPYWGPACDTFQSSYLFPHLSIICMLRIHLVSIIIARIPRTAQKGISKIFTVSTENPHSRVPVHKTTKCNSRLT